MGNLTKKEAISIVVDCAHKYETELNGKKLLFLCTDKHKKVFAFEFSFHAHNFMHLTGLKANTADDPNAKLFANDFYQKCLNHKLSEADFMFAEDGTTQLKLLILPNIICKNLQAKMIGDHNSLKPKLTTDKLAGNIKMCMGFQYNEDDSEYVPNTILREDMRNIISNQLQIIATYRKNIRDEKYQELTYKSPKADWSKIKYPDEYSYLLKIT